MAQTAVKLVDTNRKVIYKFTGIGENGRVLKIDAGSLYGALNSSGKVFLSSDPTGSRLPFYRLLLKSVYSDVSGGYSANNSSYVEITNDSTNNPNTIVVLSSGQNQWQLEGAPEPFLFDCMVPSANATGNIWLNAQHAGTTSNSYTIILEFRKDPAYYSAGQIEDPMSFNQGPRSISGAFGNQG